jgi:hypothetical protein
MSSEADVSDPFDFGGGPGDGSFVEAEPSVEVRFTKPPYLWLGLGVGVSLAGAVLSWVFNSLPVAVSGWFLAGPVGLTLLAWYLNRDGKARVEGVYSASAYARHAYFGAVALCVTAVVLAAVRVAIGVGRL